MKTALEQNREDQALGAAWRRCEAALPVRSRLKIEFFGDHKMAYAGVRMNRDVLIAGRSKATPTEALTALAEALEARRE